MFEFPKMFYIPLAKWTDSVMDWMLMHWGEFFDSVGQTLLTMLVQVERLFLWVPWPVVLVLTFIAGWRIMGKLRAGAVMSLMLFAIGCFGYWDFAMMTLSLVVGAVVLSLAGGVPIGILMAKSDRFQAVMKPLLDAMQTMPSFVYLIPVLMFFGLGKVPALFATIIYAMPPLIRLTNVGIREVPKDVLECSQAFGATGWQTLLKVELPLARPTIVVGVNQTTMMALSMVVVASMIGARGLGMEVLVAINRIEVGRGFVAGLSIVILAIIIDRLTHAMASAESANA